MKDIAIKWINDNAKEIKAVVTGYMVLNLLVVSLAIISGEFLNLLLLVPRILITEILLVVPSVFLYKNFK